RGVRLGGRGGGRARGAGASFLGSSRRRHTRFSRDWSSDVCSSDLVEKPPGVSLTRCAGSRLVNSSRHAGYGSRKVTVTVLPPPEERKGVVSGQRVARGRGPVVGEEARGRHEARAPPAPVVQDVRSH